MGRAIGVRCPSCEVMALTKRSITLGFTALLALAPARLCLAVDPPATQELRYTLSVPPGFKLVEASGVKAICQEAEEDLIRQALTQVIPATRPTTMPADLLTRLSERSADILKQIASDYALEDTSVLEPHIQKLRDDIEALSAFRPPLFFLCATDEKLKEILKSGVWTCPGIYYNRYADRVMYRETIPLSVDRPMDDTVVAVVASEKDGPQALADKLKSLVEGTEAELGKLVSGRSMFLVQAMFIDMVMQEVFDPLKLPTDQQWLGVGLAGVTSADYAANIIGSPRRELLMLIAAELRMNPIRMSTIDLLKPTSPESLKREYVAAYADAYRRKSMRAAGKILDSAKEKLPELVRSLRENPCGSGEDLLRRIHEITDVDLSQEVKAQ